MCGVCPNPESHQPGSTCIWAAFGQIGKSMGLGGSNLAEGCGQESLLGKENISPSSKRAQWHASEHDSPNKHDRFQPLLVP